MRPVDILREKVLCEMLAEKNQIILSQHQEIEGLRSHIERCEAEKSKKRGRKACGNPPPEA